MLNKRRIRTVVWAALIAIAIPVMFVRCTPQWSSDSKSVVYVSGKREVVWCNLETGRQLRLTNVPTIHSTAAMWPTGDRFALSAFDQPDPSATENHLAIRVHTLDGELVHESEKYRYTQEKPDSNFMIPVTYVANDQRHIVTFLPGVKKCVIYDIKQEKFSELNDVIPPMSVAGQSLIHFVNRPFPADGRGMLVLKATDELNDLEFLFYKWDSDEPLSFHVSERASEAIGKLKAERKVGVWTQWRWSNGLLVSDMQNGQLQIDPKMRTVHWTGSEEAESVMTHATDNQTMVFAKLADGVRLQIKGTAVELWDPRSVQRPLQVHEWKDQQLGFVSVSPDGKKFLLRTFGPKLAIKVFDTSGRLLVNHSDELKLVP